MRPGRSDGNCARTASTSNPVVVALMRRVARERGTTVLMVTHDNRVFDLADRILEMEDGRIVGSRQGDAPPVQRAGPGHRLEHTT